MSSLFKGCTGTNNIWLCSNITGPQGSAWSTYHSPSLNLLASPNTFLCIWGTVCICVLVHHGWKSVNAKTDMTYGGWFQAGLEVFSEMPFPGLDEVNHPEDKEPPPHCGQPDRKGSRSLSDPGRMLGNAVAMEALLCFRFSLAASVSKWQAFSWGSLGNERGMPLRMQDLAFLFTSNHLSRGKCESQQFGSFIPFVVWLTNYIIEAK